MNIKKFFQVKRPAWLTIDADVESAEIIAIVKRGEEQEIDWAASRYLYWHKNPFKLLMWRLKNGKEGKRLLERKRLEQGG